MKSRMLGSVVVVLLALGVLATSASAAKPKLWLAQIRESGFERAAPGSPVLAVVQTEGCSVEEEGTLASNGKASDKLSLDPVERVEECSNGKLAGTITGVTLAAAGEAAAMTVKARLHILLEPWCVYSPPKSITLPPSKLTEFGASVTAALDVRGSHGTCPSTHAFQLYFRVLETFLHEPFWAEVVE